MAYNSSKEYSTGEVNVTFNDLRRTPIGMTAPTIETVHYDDIVDGRRIMQRASILTITDEHGNFKVLKDRYVTANIGKIIYAVNK